MFDLTKRVCRGPVGPANPQRSSPWGLNYQSHLQGRPAPQTPIFFIKANTALIPHGGMIVMPPGVGRVDSEGELVMVIKRHAKRVPRKQVFDYILGYTCGNDVSARAYQQGDVQWMRAKSIDTFAPLGPCIETDLDTGKVEVDLAGIGVLRNPVQAE
jgi:2-keto-4-pentenoate hydratase/2-oxohepta-3-ene-1,7-dioic acid hydratase in catechol pathway